MPELTAERARRLYDELLAGGVSDPFVVVHEWAGRATPQETRRLLGLDGDASLPQWEVEVLRTISTTVAVHAATAQAAAELVERRDFPLPPATSGAATRTGRCGSTTRRARRSTSWIADAPGPA
jgi:hypothetical protein